MKKRLAVLLCVTALVGVLCACGSNSESKDTKNTSDVATETSKEEVTEAPKAEIAEAATDAEAPKEEIAEAATDAETTEEMQNIPEQDPAVTEGFVGFHQSNNDASSFEITKGENGNYNVNISIASLASFASTNGTFANMKMSFTATDRDGNPISGIIYRESDGTCTIEFTNSTWEFIKNGDKYTNFE